MGDLVLYQVQDRIAVITLNRPEALNSINRPLKADLADVLKRFDEDDSAWVGIIRGSGRAFCAGRDLKERAEDNAAGRKPRGIESMGPGTLFMWSLPQKPLIAAVHGYALAGGWSVVQMCDLRVASEDAMLGITEARVGLIPPFGVQLNKLLPEAVVMEMVLAGQHFPAKRLQELGFINKVVPAEKLMDAATEMARAILANAPLSVRAFKQLVIQCRALSEKDAAVLTEAAYDRLLVTLDSVEGPKAFAEKRPPHWQAR